MIFGTLHCVEHEFYRPGHVACRLGAAFSENPEEADNGIDLEIREDGFVQTRDEIPCGSPGTSSFQKIGQQPYTLIADCLHSKPEIVIGHRGPEVDEFPLEAYVTPLQQPQYDGPRLQPWFSDAAPQVVRGRHHCLPDFRR